MRIRFTLAVLLSSLLLAACDNGGSGAAEAEAPASSSTPTTFARSVRVISPEQGVLSTTRRVTVTVESRQESLVASGANGRVASIVKDEGSQVEAGDIVIQLDDEQLQLQLDNARVQVASARVNLSGAEAASSEGAAQAQAGLQAAELNLQLQQRTFEEGQQLYEAGAISRAELTGLEAQLAQARSAYRQAQDAVNRSGRAGNEDIELLRLQLQAAETQLAQAENQVQEAGIRAPFAGTVVSVMANPGEFLGAGQPAFRLTSSGPQLARFSVPTEDVALLSREGELQIEYAGRTYSATLRPTSGVPAQGRLVSLTAELDAASEPIPAGAVASLSYQVDLGSGDILPSTAVRGGNTVLIVRDGRTEAVSVNVTAEAGGQVIVTGLPEDAAVVHPLPADLMPDTAVEVLN